MELLWPVWRPSDGLNLIGLSLELDSKAPRNLADEMASQVGQLSRLETTRHVFSPATLWAQLSWLERAWLGTGDVAGTASGQLTWRCGGHGKRVSRQALQEYVDIASIKAAA